MNTQNISLTKYAWLSIGTAILTILLKSVAWKMTGSVGLLSDAIESLVNLAGACMALWMLTIAAKPADSDHAYGHGKAEYFASGFEGILILLAALSIGYTAIQRLYDPQPLEAAGIGLIVSCAASALNYIVARVLMTAGKKYNSITLTADSHHLMTDVWTSIGVISAVGLVYMTNWLILDSIIAIAVALNIIYVGIKLIIQSINGLMDTAVDSEKVSTIIEILNNYTEHNISFTQLKTRQAGSQMFVTVTILVPENWTVKIGHDYAEEIENRLKIQFPNINIITHVEPNIII